MDMTRRSLIALSAGTAVAAGGTVFMASASTAADRIAARPGARGLETDYDLKGLQANPGNRLGCPLGKGA